MDFGLAGKRVLVAGGSSGIGLAVGHAFVGEGADVILLGRDPGKLERAVDDLRKVPGPRVTGHAVDMLSRPQIRELAARLVDGGGLDVLVINSGRPPMPMREFLDETEESRWRDGYEQQLLAPLHTMLELTPLLLDKEWSRLVAITSATVKQPMPHHAISTVFRAGVAGALKHLATENAAKGLTVNAVAPASILTEGLARNNDLGKRAASIPARRLGTLEELAATVVFLSSRQAGFITGQTIQVDGGMTASLC